MIRIFEIAVFGCIGLAVAGCNGTERYEPVWKDVKIADLAPSGTAKQPELQLLKTINFNVYIFEVPVEQIGILDEIWPILYTKPLHFDDYQAFRNNSFLAGFGEIQMWNKVADMLRQAGGRRAETDSLLLPDGQSEAIAVAGLRAEQTIFYISAEGSMTGAAMGPGRVALRLKAERIAGQRGVCKMEIVPVFSPLITSAIPQLAAREQYSDRPFTCCRFTVQMSPGDFVLLGPEKYVNHHMTLGGLLFSRGGRKPVVRTYLIICTGIID